MYSSLYEDITIKPGRGTSLSLIQLSPFSSRTVLSNTALKFLLTNTDQVRARPIAVLTPSTFSFLVIRLPVSKVLPSVAGKAVFCPFGVIRCQGQSPFNLRAVFGRPLGQLCQCFSLPHSRVPLIFFLIGGADVIAAKDLSVTGGSVVIEPGHDKRSRDETF